MFFGAVACDDSGPKQIYCGREPPVMSAISEKKNVDMLCSALGLTPAEELEARKQDSVFDGSDPSEIPPDDEAEEEWPKEEEPEVPRRWKREDE